MWGSRRQGSTRDEGINLMLTFYWSSSQGSTREVEDALVQQFDLVHPLYPQERETARKYKYQYQNILRPTGTGGPGRAWS